MLLYKNPLVQTYIKNINRFKTLLSLWTKQHLLKSDWRVRERKHLAVDKQRLSEDALTSDSFTSLLAPCWLTQPSAVNYINVSIICHPHICSSFKGVCEEAIHGCLSVLSMCVYLFVHWLLVHYVTLTSYSSWFTLDVSAVSQRPCMLHVFHSSSVSSVAVITVLSYVICLLLNVPFCS